MIQLSELSPVGKIGKTHGVKGEFTVDFSADFNLDACDYFILDMDAIFVPFFISSCRFKNDSTALVMFDGVTNEPSAREFYSKIVYIKKELLQEREDESQLNSYVGFTMITGDGETVGVIESVDETTANVLFEVGDHLIPVAALEIISIDDTKKIVKVELPEGLLEIN